MTVKILIKRKFKNANPQNVSEVIYEFRKLAMLEKGYISSETLYSSYDPNVILVLSMWQKKEDWDRYMKNPVRQETEQKCAGLFEEPTEYEPFILGLPFAQSDRDFIEPLEF